MRYVNTEACCVAAVQSRQKTATSCSWL